MSNKNKVGLSILVFLALMLSLIIFYGDRVVISFYGGKLVFNHSTSMSGHEISVGDTNFCVAKSYFVYSNSFYPDSSIGLVLAADIDGLEPWNVYLERVGFYKNKKNMSKNEIEGVKRKRIGVDIGYLRDKGGFLEALWRDSLKGAKENDEGRYTKLVSSSPLAAMYNYYLIPRGSSDYSRVIGCNQGGRCGLRSRYNDAIWYKIDFDESVLWAVESIESRVREFMDDSICN